MADISLLNSVWVIGGGKFGEMASEKLRIKNSKADITIIEKNPDKCRDLNKRSFNTICDDGVLFLAKQLTRSESPDWIVPAVPIHLAYLWVKKRLLPDYRITSIEVPEEVIKRLPNPIKGKTDVYTSIADFICPENCPEPPSICTVTKKTRPCIVFNKIKEICPKGFLSIVIKSRQLAPGIGGYQPEILFNALSLIKKTDLPVILSTACKCHGVLSAFKAEKEKTLCRK